MTMSHEANHHVLDKKEVLHSLNELDVETSYLPEALDQGLFPPTYVTG